MTESGRLSHGLLSLKSGHKVFLSLLQPIGSDVEAFLEMGLIHNQSSRNPTIILFGFDKPGLPGLVQSEAVQGSPSSVSLLANRIGNEGRKSGRKLEGKSGEFIGSVCLGLRFPPCCGDQ